MHIAGAGTPHEARILIRSDQDAGFVISMQTSGSDSRQEPSAYGSSIEFWISRRAPRSVVYWSYGTSCVTISTDSPSLM